MKTTGNSIVMTSIDFKAILRERGFLLSFRDFGRIVKLTPHHLRVLYRTDQERFLKLLDTAIERWNSICEKII